MSQIFNYIKNYNYIEDYFSTVYNYYIHGNRSFPVTYYDIDLKNTIWDNENYDSTSGSAGLKNGSYEPGGVGELSGVKFRKIMLLPVHNLEQVIPTLENSEKGYTAVESMVTSFTIPEMYGLKPLANCVVNLNHGLKNNTDTVLFQITNVSFGHFGEGNNSLQFYKCECRVASFTKEDIEKQLSSIHIFYEPTKSILPASNALLLTKVLTRANNLNNNFKELFEKNASIYYDHIIL